MRGRGEDLTRPRKDRRGLGIHYDTDAFGQFSEAIARFLGTARYLVFQTVLIAFWIGYNLFIPASWRFDPYGRGLVLLTLVLSLQASYAAPLILLAQNRQERRDRSQSATDRRVAERTQADTEFLARELTSVRLTLGDMVTTEDIDDRLQKLTEALERLSQQLESQRLDEARPSPPSSPSPSRARPGKPPSQRAAG
jgi:uncharacterized membrane protein